MRRLGSSVLMREGRTHSLCTDAPGREQGGLACVWLLMVEGEREGPEGGHGTH